VFVVPIPAVLYAAMFVGYSIWSDLRERDRVNHQAHLWGAAYGVAFALLLEPRLGPAFVVRLLHPSLD